MSNPLYGPCQGAYCPCGCGGQFLPTAARIYTELWLRLREEACGHHQHRTDWAGRSFCLDCKHEIDNVSVLVGAVQRPWTVRTS